MSKVNGWVKIHRKLLDTELTASQFKFFVGAILLARSPQSKDSGLVDLSIRQLSRDLGMSRSEVQRREKELEEMGTITLLGKGFTINNYDYYQIGKTVPPTGQLQDTGTICWVCGQHEMLPPMKDYSAWLTARFQEHHIIPTPKGENEPDNRVQLCQLCHKQAHHNQLSVKRDLSAASQKNLELLQSKSVPYTGQNDEKLNTTNVPPTGLNVPPEGPNVPPTGQNVPSHTSESDNKNIKNIKKDKNAKEKKENISKTFNIFWKAYPRKVAKADAEKVFNKIYLNEHLLETMLTAIEVAKKSEGWQKENGKFIPHPATWLNGKRWEDEIVVKAPGTKSKFNDGWK